MRHCRDLNFEEKPDYQLLLSLMNDIATKEGYNIHDGQFDWVIREWVVGYSPFNPANRSPYQQMNFTDYNHYKEQKIKGFYNMANFDDDLDLRPACQQRQVQEEIKKKELDEKRTVKRAIENQPKMIPVEKLAVVK